MTKSTTTQLADDLVTALNAATKPVESEEDTEPTEEEPTFCVNFTAVRVTLPMFRLEDLDEVQVTVVPRGRKTDIFTRGENTKTHTVEIGVQKKLTNVNDSTECDPIALLVEQIEDWVLNRDVGGLTCVQVESILGDDSLFAKEHIQSDKVYTSVLVATFND